MTFDYLVIGAGPAGLQLAALLHHTGRDYTILEQGPGPGTFFTHYPRHRTLISINKVHTGYTHPEQRLRMDWNSLLPPTPDTPSPLFTTYTPHYFPHADTLPHYLTDYATTHNIQPHYNTTITHITRNPTTHTFTATDQHHNTHHANNIIIATGLTQPNTPDIPGIHTTDTYNTHNTDPHHYTDKRVLIIGKGNSAFETADNLIETAAVIHVAGPHSVRMAWQSHFVGHVRAVNNNFLDTYQLKSQNSVLDGHIEHIERLDDGTYRVLFRYARTVEKVRELHYDRIITCTGFRWDATIFDESCRPELTIGGRFPAITSSFESVNVPNVFFAGTITQSRDFKRGTSGFIHGFRYGVRALHRILEQRTRDREWPATPIAAEPEAISDAIIARVNRSSALWQQFGVLGDAVTVAGDTALYQEEVPVGYVADGGLGPAAHRFVTTLEYGPHHDIGDPFDISITRVAENDAANAHEANYLHPVVRYYRDGEFAGSHHLAENLDNAWDLPDVHQQPLTTFVKECLAG